MSKQIKALILLFIFMLTSLGTWTAAAAKPAYSKTLGQIYHSKEVYRDTETRLSELNKNYSNITYLFTIGKSVQNRNLTVIKVGSGPKKIFINASHHPREYMGTILALNQIQYILEAYSANRTLDGYSIKKLLDKEVSFYFMPLVNPDGVQICVNGAPSYYFNANKVDLNHNYDALWQKEITDTYSTGPKAFSEPETQAVKALCENVEFDLTIAYHAAGDIIYWYFGQEGADRQRDLAYANMLKSLTGYSLVSPANYKSSTSGFKDWCVMKLKIPSFTIEIGGKRGLYKPVEWSWYNSVWQKNQLVPIRTAKQLLKQTRFQGDKKTALIFNKSLVVLSQNIISENGKSYISAEDAQNLGYARLSRAAQEQLDASQATIKNIPCIPLASFAEHLGLDCRYEKAVNTYYID